MPYYNHHEHYGSLLLRQVPAQCQKALDIGCGESRFARRLAGRFKVAVTGIDPDQDIIRQARAETSQPAIRFVEGDFLGYRFEELFDFISATAALHRMPFEQALEKMISLLRPGGVLAVLGCFRETGLADLGIALVASPINTNTGAK